MNTYRAISTLHDGWCVVDANNRLGTRCHNESEARDIAAAWNRGRQEDALAPRCSVCRRPILRADRMATGTCDTTCEAIVQADYFARPAVSRW